MFKKLRIRVFGNGAVVSAADGAGLPGDVPIVTLATAHPAKFAEIVDQAYEITASADRIRAAEHQADGGAYQADGQLLPRSRAGAAPRV